MNDEIRIEQISLFPDEKLFERACAFLFDMPEFALSSQLRIGGI